MIASIDDSELRKLILDTSIAERGAIMFARKVIRGASFGLEKEVKRRMPVDTGRARASWGHWRSGQLRKAGREAGAAGESDAIWQEDEGGLSITQGSNVEYIPFLEAGHSQQAPVGFIELSTLKAELALEAALGLFDPLEAEASINQINLVLDFG